MCGGYRPHTTADSDPELNALETAEHARRALNNTRANVRCMTNMLAFALNTGREFLANNDSRMARIYLDSASKAADELARYLDETT